MKHREKWNYDERTGMVAVYSGEKRNCLVGPFIFCSHFDRAADGEFIRDELACQNARLIVDDHEYIVGLEAELAKVKQALHDAKAMVDFYFSSEGLRDRLALKYAAECMPILQACESPKGVFNHDEDCWLAKELKGEE